MDKELVKMRRWLEDAVIGLNLCPFARAVYVRDQVRIAVKPARGFDDAIRCTLDEADRLFRSAPDEIATTLVVLPNALTDFDEFLDAADAIDALIERAGAAGILQLAHFHPDYNFEGAEPDALENYTNRAPYPTLHLLREAQVSEGVQSYPDPESIPERNIEMLEGMGRAELAKMWAHWSHH